ncbi:MAG: GNAT family N-acetyltransferase [Butyrivibrio sp.]|nr:GNAT family N-acetyltransferase [Butyrivibrio sp.]
MTGTLVTMDNLEFFLPILDIAKEQIDPADIIIGVIDDESGTACGVLRAVAQKDNILAVRYIYVDTAFRQQGAGKELIRFLQDISTELSVKSIRCFYVRNEENRYLYNILDSAGFVDESKELDVYTARVGDFDIDGLSYETKGIKVFCLSDIPVERRTFLPDTQNGSFDEELSVVAADENGNKGMILFGPFGDYIEIRHMDLTGEKKNLILYSLLSKAVRSAVEKNRSGDWILIYAQTDMAKALLARLTDDTAIRFTDCVMFNLQF